jgi:hypothetical protein
MAQPLGHALVVRPGALGDAILTLPALHALRLAGAESLTVLGTPVNWSFVRTAHESLRVRDFSSAEWLGLFAAGVTLGAAARAALSRTQTAVVFMPADGVVRQALHAARVHEVLLIEPPTTANAAATPGSEPLHAARRMLDPLCVWLGTGHAEAALRILAAPCDVFLRLDELEVAAALHAAGYDAPPPGGFVALHPGSGGRKKCWPAPRFAQLAARAAMHGATPLVFFGPADDDVRTEFEDAMPPGVHWDCVACRPLREVLALLTQAAWFVGNDAGLSHLAARACPTVALFGPTDPRVWAPLGKRVRVLRAPEGDLSRLAVADVAEAAVQISHHSEPRT